jgi:8-amino-7-oxononanoate synthase
MIAGSTDFIRRFRAKSQTRVHCSPPSAAAVSAAKHALDINGLHGNALRRRLAQSVRFFKRQLFRISTPANRGLFPVQTLKRSSFTSPQSLHHSLQRVGVRTVLHRNCNSRAPRISFLITIRHTLTDIRLAGQMLAAITINTGLAEKIQSSADEISAVRRQLGAA